MQHTLCFFKYDVRKNQSKDILNVLQSRGYIRKRIEHFLLRLVFGHVIPLSLTETFRKAHMYKCCPSAIVETS